MFAITSCAHLSPASSVQTGLLGTLTSSTMSAHQRAGDKGAGLGFCGNLYRSDGARQWKCVGYGKETRFEIWGARCSSVGKLSSAMLKL